MIRDKEPMTPRRAIKIAWLVCEYERETTAAAEWQSELKEVVTLLDALAQKLGE